MKLTSWLLYRGCLCLPELCVEIQFAKVLMDLYKGVMHLFGYPIIKLRDPRIRLVQFVLCQLLLNVHCQQNNKKYYKSDCLKIIID